MRSLFCAAFLFLLSAGICSAQETTNTELLPAAAVKPEPVVLSQGDRRWKNIRLGNSTIGTDGCLAMGVAMFLIEKELIDDPSDLMPLFKQKKLFTPAGRMYIDRLVALFDFKIIERRKVARQHVPATTRNWLSQDVGVFLKLDRNSAQRGIQEHWVRVARMERDSLIVVDPDGGRIGALENLYARGSIEEMLILGKS